MESKKGSIEVFDAPLKFKVYLKAVDGRWTLRAAFMTDLLAGAYVIGLRSVHDHQAKIFHEDIAKELWDITEAAVAGATAAIKEEMEKKTGLADDERPLSVTEDSLRLAKEANADAGRANQDNLKKTECIEKILGYCHEFINWKISNSQYDGDAVGIYAVEMIKRIQGEIQKSII